MIKLECHTQQYIKIMYSLYRETDETTGSELGHRRWMTGIFSSIWNSRIFGALRQDSSSGLRGGGSKSVNKMSMVNSTL